MRIRESIRKFTYGDVDAFTWFCTAIAIFFVVKQSCSSGRIELFFLKNLNERNGLLLNSEEGGYGPCFLRLCLQKEDLISTSNYRKTRWAFNSH